MKFKYNILAFLGLILLVSSCKLGLDELNVDPNNPTEVDFNLILPQAMTQAIFNEGTNPNRVCWNYHPTIEWDRCTATWI